MENVTVKTHTVNAARIIRFRSTSGSQRARQRLSSRFSTASASTRRVMIGSRRPRSIVVMPYVPTTTVATDRRRQTLVFSRRATAGTGWFRMLISLPNSCKKSTRNRQSYFSATAWARTLRRAMPCASETNSLHWSFPDPRGLIARHSCHWSVGRAHPVVAPRKTRCQSVARSNWVRQLQ